MDLIWSKIMLIDTKKISIATLLAVLLNAIALAYFLGIQTADIKNLIYRVTKLEQTLEKATEDRYRAKDALRDFEIRDSRLDKLENRIEKLENR